MDGGVQNACIMRKCMQITCSSKEALHVLHPPHARVKIGDELLALEAAVSVLQGLWQVLRAGRWWV